MISPLSALRVNRGMFVTWKRVREGSRGVGGFRKGELNIPLHSKHQRSQNNQQLNLPPITRFKNPASVASLAGKIFTSHSLPWDPPYLHGILPLAMI